MFKFWGSRTEYWRPTSTGDAFDWGPWKIRTRSTRSRKNPCIQPGLAHISSLINDVCDVVVIWLQSMNSSQCTRTHRTSFLEGCCTCTRSRGDVCIAFFILMFPNHYVVVSMYELASILRTGVGSLRVNRSDAACGEWTCCLFCPWSSLKLICLPSSRRVKSPSYRCPWYFGWFTQFSDTQFYQA